MNPVFLLIGQGLSVSAKITAFAYLLRSYRKSLRKSAVMFSLAFLFMALQVVGDVLSYERMTSVMEAMAASLVFYTVILLFNEEGFSLNLHKGLLISFTPFALALYMLASEALGVSADWMAIIGVTYGISGLFMVFSGVMLLGITGLYGNDVKYLGTLLVFYGLHEMDYPFLRPVDWFAPIGFSISAALTILLALAAVRFSRAEWFVGLSAASEIKEPDLAPGTILITSEEYRRMLPELGNLPVLAFLREIADPPSGWTVYFVTQVEGERNIPPTSLPRILELSNRYLNSLEGRGIVVLDCLEYLTIYNGFDAVAKFLGTLRDFAVIHKGTVLIVSERTAWNEREWRLLQRILSG